MAVIVVPLLSEPEMQGRPIRERQRPVRNPKDSLVRRRVSRDRSRHDLEGDGVGLAGDEEMRSLLLEAQHYRDQDSGGLVGGRDLEDALLDTLPDDGGE